MPYQVICEAWTKDPSIFKINPHHLFPGPYIFWVLRTGAPWRALPQEFGPQTTCYNRFVRWRKAGVWDRILAAVTTAYDGDVQMIDSTPVRVHQHAANSKKATRIAVWAARAAG